MSSEVRTTMSGTSDRATGFALVRWLLGMLLVAAGGLKLQQPAAGLVGVMPETAAFWVLLGVIEVEIVLGLWLLSGLASRACWVAGLVFFLSRGRGCVVERFGGGRFVRVFWCGGG